LDKRKSHSNWSENRSEVAQLCYFVVVVVVLGGPARSGRLVGISRQ